jgi:acetyltransferase
MDEAQSKELLNDYGIPVARSHIACSADDAVNLADQIGYPVVLKVVSPDISHKTDVGGVVLNVPSAEVVRDRYVSIMESVRSRMPSARITGISVQQVISQARGVELLLGMTRDPQFGPVILVGAGGITAELQKDSALEIPPFDETVIERMLCSLRLSPLLKGYRGRTGVDLEKLRKVMARFVHLVEDLPQLATAEINPLLASPNDVIALDARIIVSSRSSRAG